MLANAFINNQFNYAPLVWMFAGKTSINKICKTHHRTLHRFSEEAFCGIIFL